jgi:hypothetical protein
MLQPDQKWFGPVAFRNLISLLMPPPTSKNKEASCAMPPPKYKNKDASRAMA